jgi:RecA/RadA recombinase
MSNKWIKQLKAYDDAVDYNYDSFAQENCLYTPSPYFNWIFANKANGVPKNSSVLFFSEPKAGKSLSIYAAIMEMQKNDPEGIAIYFNTELRGALQNGVFPGLDRDRLVIYDSNDPTEIFDRVETDIKALVQDGMPLRIIAIDSLTNIQGVKRAAADSVANHLMGDRALTIQTGLSKLVPFCKRNKILLLATEQVRANMDGGYGAPKEKMAASWATKHSFEYFVSLKRAGAAEDKVDIEGKTFEEEEIKDARGNKLLNGHKVYVKMEASSVGPAGRAGVFTISYEEGIVNQHEEIFFLGVNTGVIKKEGFRNYYFENEKWSSKKDCAFAIKDNPELAQKILKEIKKLDEK